MDGQLLGVLGLESGFAGDTTDLVNRQAEVRGDLLVKSERIIVVEDDLLDDGACPPVALEKLCTQRLRPQVGSLRRARGV